MLRRFQCLRRVAQLRIAAGQVPLADAIGGEVSHELSVFLNTILPVTCEGIVQPAVAIAFPLGHAVFVFHRKLHVLYGVPRPAQVLGHGRHAGVRPRKLRIQLRSLLERIERLLEFARELFVDADSVLVNSLKRCGGKTSADFIELHRGGRGVAQGFANRRRQLGKAAQNVLLVGDGDFRFCEHLAAHGVQSNRRNIVFVASQIDLARNHRVDVLVYGDQPRCLLVELVAWDSGVSRPACAHPRGCRR